MSNVVRYSIGVMIKWRCRSRGGKDTRRRKTEKEEDEELLHDADGVPEVSDGTTRDDEPFVFTESPICGSIPRRISSKNGRPRD